MRTRQPASEIIHSTITHISMAILLAVAFMWLTPIDATAQDTPPTDPLDEFEVDAEGDPTEVEPVDEEDLEEAAEDAETTKSGKGIETLVISARKREDDLQDVPIAVSAFSGQTLDVNHIESTQELQFSVPNMLFSKTNFTGSNLQIRGIGNSVVSSSGEPAVGIHINEVPLTTSRIFEQEFYDVERIEVLRGPQGTLFGRNSTGGSFNVYTKRPTDELSMNAEVSAGNYANAQVSGAINIPIGDNLRTRIAGMYTRRNGYIDNIETGDDIDNRSLYGIRGSITWDITDNFTADAMVSWFDENDNRSRIGKQLCNKDTQAGVLSLGCTDDPPGFDSLASYATLGGILENYTLQLLGLPSMNSPGYSLPGPSNPLDTSGTNPADFRKHDSRINPTYSANELFADLNLNYETDFGSFIALFGYQSTEVNSVQGYGMAEPAFPWDAAAVGAVLAAAAGTGLNGCTSAAGNPGMDIPTFGCVDRSFSQDNAVADSTQVSGELRFSSDFDGPINFTAGTIYTYFSTDTDYFVYFSGAEMLSRIWANAIAPAGATYDFETLRAFNNETKPAITNSFGLYAEGDYQFLETWTLTGGIRYTNDRKDVRSRNYLLNGLLQQVPPFTTEPPDYQKQEASWNAVTGRGILNKDLDLPFTDQSNAYLSYSRGYKPGGFNPPAAAAFPGTAETFEPEYINAFELGSKNRLLDNNLQSNLSAFFYDYKGYQISKIVNRTSVNENIDAFVWGVEAEFIYQVIEDFFVTTNFAYLGTTIRNGSSIDPADPADIANNPGDIVFKRLDNASNLVCPASAAATCNAVPGPGSIEPFPPTYEDGNGNLLAPYTDGNAKNLDGNELPNSPKFSISVGAAYTFKLLIPGEFTPRISYYWQSKMYGRIYNSARDEIGSWSQANAGLRWNDDENRLWADFWIQNFTNNNDITTQYFTDASSGNFTNVFLLEPLTVGATVGFSF